MAVSILLLGPSVVTGNHHDALATPSRFWPFFSGFSRFWLPKHVQMALASLGIPFSGLNTPNGPVQAMFNPFLVLGGL